MKIIPPTFKLSREDFCVVVLDRDRFLLTANAFCFKAHSCVWLPGHYQLIQFCIGGFVVQDATAVELLREIQREQQGY